MRRLLFVLLLVGCSNKSDHDGDGNVVGVDCDDYDEDVRYGATELCDGVDNDCDGNTDGSDAEDAPTWYLDYDGDGYGAPDFHVRDCDRPDSYVSDSGDCDDRFPEINPVATEICDFIDNDCDDEIDEDDAADVTRWYEDADHDGSGSTSSYTEACAQPTGYTQEANDCDDEDPEIYRDATERCDLIDNDCDGQIDEDDAMDAGEWYADADGDGYGDPAAVSIDCVAPVNTSADPEDCDDTDADVNPRAPERCDDFVDNDCDGSPGDCDLEGAYTADIADAWIIGVAAYDNVGVAARGVGDGNGDGYDDLAVGVPGDDTRGSAAGLAALFSGPIKGELASTDAEGLLVGANAGDQAGSSVAGLGDMDGDGYADLVVGAPGEDSAASAAGASYVVYGPISGIFRLQRSDGLIYGEAADDHAGAAVACAGDIDGDGDTDLLVGAPGDDTEQTDSGAAYLVLGPLEGELSLTDAEARLLGYGESAMGGHAVDGDFDLGGDGYSDIIVAAPWDAAAGDYAGAVYILDGPISGTISLPHDAITLKGATPGDAAGYGAVANAGDVNSDGYGDFTVGAVGYDDGDSNVGIAYLVYGPVSIMSSLSLSDAALIGEDAGANLGSSVAGAGDVDGDGFDDLLIGARGVDDGGSDAGAAYLVYGPMSGFLKADVAAASFVGLEAGDLVGSSVGGAGDTDGNGFADLVFGGTSASNDRGEVWLVLGGGL